MPLPLPNTQTAMANFTIDPQPFVLPALFLEDGGSHRHARRTVYIGGGLAKTHEDCVIAICEGELIVAQHHQLLQDINQHLTHEVRLQVCYFSLHPHGVGIFRMCNACQRDALVALNPHYIVLRQVSFIPHDEALMNFRLTALSTKSWIMLLVYPLDLKDSASITQACAPFSHVLHWNSNDTGLSRVLLKVLIEYPLEVLRSLIIKLGREADGNGRS
jgi:hypothetical protein